MTKSRVYQSDRRKQQAASTRRDILSAGRHLFATRGYASTSLTDIAGKAGVSVPTLYASVGSKAEIARSLVEFVNDEAEIAELDRVQQEKMTGPELIRANVHLTRVLNERCGDIISAIDSAAASEPEVKPAMEAGRRYHREGEYTIANRLGQLNALREGMSPNDAGAIMSTLASYEVWRLFAQVENWPYERIEEWLSETLIRLLLRPETVSAPDVQKNGND